jgi:adenosylcobinamide kinase/adenosylcobinamide-phosphate guanylyltransferase
MGDFILVTGGARSGKSRFAELLAARSGLPVTYIATAQIWDEEMAERVEKHRQSRPAEWNVIEEPYDIEKTLLALQESPGLILLDCVTIWLTNLLLDESRPADEAAILAQVKKVAQTAADSSSRVIFVTNEVGQGIVPDNPLARKYRDLAGRANQILAQAADSVFIVIAGYPLEIKHQGQQILNSLLSQE